MIQASRLVVSRSGQPILQVESLVVARGQKLMIEGPNGSGKTTLLKLLARIDLNYQGEFNCECGKQQTVYVHQEPYLFRGSVLQNLMIGLSAHSVDTDLLASRIEKWTSLLNIKHLKGRTAQRLSGGEKKKVAIARAMIREPSLLLMDEPLAELDGDSAAALVEAIKNLDSMTIVATTPHWDERFHMFQRTSMQDLKHGKKQTST